MMEPCVLCGQSLTPNHPDTWKQVTGFVGGPKKDSMRLREDTGRYAHDDCVKLAQSGQDPSQPSLFDMTQSASPVFLGSENDDLEGFLDEQ